MVDIYTVKNLEKNNEQKTYTFNFDPTAYGFRHNPCQCVYLHWFKAIPTGAYELRIMKTGDDLKIYQYINEPDSRRGTVLKEDGKVFHGKLPNSNAEFEAIMNEVTNNQKKQ